MEECYSKLHETYMEPRNYAGSGTKAAKCRRNIPDQVVSQPSSNTLTT